MSSCVSGKRSYSRHNAIRKLSQIRELRRKRTYELTGGRTEHAFYRCARCGRWHLTSQAEASG